MLMMVETHKFMENSVHGQVKKRDMTEYVY